MFAIITLYQFLLFNLSCILCIPFIYFVSIVILQNAEKQIKFNSIQRRKKKKEKERERMKERNNRKKEERKKKEKERRKKKKQMKERKRERKKERKEGTGGTKHGKTKFNRRAAH